MRGSQVHILVQRLGISVVKGKDSQPNCVAGKKKVYPRYLNVFSYPSQLNVSMQRKTINMYILSTVRYKNAWMMHPVMKVATEGKTHQQLKLNQSC